MILLITQLLYSRLMLLLMCIRETAGELAMKDARNRQRPGFTTDSVRFNNVTGFLYRTKKTTKNTSSQMSACSILLKKV